MINEFQYLISLDPSFTRTGICVIDLKNKHIYFHTASCKIGEKQFENVVHAAQSIVDQLREIFSIYGEGYRLIHESPLPQSSMSAALYGLDTLIYNTFENHILTTYNPATLRSKIHCRKYDKNDSLQLAEKYLKILSEKGYITHIEIPRVRKLPHDCAEAFLYSHLWLKENKYYDFQFDNSEEIKIFKLRQKELKRREKLLSSKKEI
jgi:hypothetical protein